jgi:hypothetical protein
VVELVLVVADVAEAVGDKMKNLNILSCPICKKDVYSFAGNGCKMCGMTLEGSESFCCKICMRKYNTINRNKGGILK